MKEPQKIKLTDSPESKKVNLTPLLSNSQYDIDMVDDVYNKNTFDKNNEDNKQNNSESISKLESL